jgi:hypothetical protein
MWVTRFSAAGSRTSAVAAALIAEDRRRSKGGDDGGPVGRVWSRILSASARMTSHELRRSAARHRRPDRPVVDEAGLAGDKVGWSVQLHLK